MTNSSERLILRRRVLSPCHAKRNGLPIPDLRPESRQDETELAPEDDLEERLSYRETVEAVCYDLNAKESRRFLLAVRYGLSNEEIAVAEGVSRPAIIRHFDRMAQKNGFVDAWLKRKNKKNQYE